MQCIVKSSALKTAPLTSVVLGILVYVLFVEGRYLASGHLQTTP
jgi:hypothetical protein